jgi:hypothetical protein
LNHVWSLDNGMDLFIALGFRDGHRHPWLFLTNSLSRKINNSV